MVRIYLRTFLTHGIYMFVRHGLKVLTDKAGPASGALGLHPKWHRIPYLVNYSLLLTRAHRAKVKSSSLYRGEDDIWDTAFALSVQPPKIIGHNRRGNQREETLLTKLINMKRNKHL